MRCDMPAVLLFNVEACSAYLRLQVSLCSIIGCADQCNTMLPPDSHCGVYYTYRYIVRMSDVFMPVSLAGSARGWCYQAASGNVRSLH